MGKERGSVKEGRCSTWRMGRKNKKPYRKPWDEERKRVIKEKEGVQHMPFPGGCLLWW